MWNIKKCQGNDQRWPWCKWDAIFKETQCLWKCSNVGRACILRAALLLSPHSRKPWIVFHPRGSFHRGGRLSVWSPLVHKYRTSAVPLVTKSIDGASLQSCRVLFSSPPLIPFLFLSFLTLFFLLSILKEMDFIKIWTQWLKNCYYGFFRIQRKPAWRVKAAFGHQTEKSSFHRVPLTPIFLGIAHSGKMFVYFGDCVTTSPTCGQKGVKLAARRTKQRMSAARNNNQILYEDRPSQTGN